MKLNKQKKNPLKPKFKKPEFDMSKPITEIYTDGACEGNGKTTNKGGYAFIVVQNDQVMYEYKNSAVNTTNNRMEMSAVIDCLVWIQENIPDEQVHIKSDSQYVVHGLNEWSRNWALKGWVDVKNADLWQEMRHQKAKVQNVHLSWVRGHSTADTKEAKWNNYVDQLAVEGCTGKRQPDKINKQACIGNKQQGEEMKLVKADPKKTLYNLTNEVCRLQNRLMENNKDLEQAEDALKYALIALRGDCEQRDTAYIMAFNWLNNRGCKF